MNLNFLRGSSQAPKGHVIFVARSNDNPRRILCTYCVVPPMPLSLAKYLPPILAAQLSPEELQDATSIPVMPIPPMLEEGSTLDRLQTLAEHRDDDLCEIGTVDPRDEAARMQMVAQACQEYGQLYLSYSSSFADLTVPPAIETEEPAPLDDLDAEELMFQMMTDRQRLEELAKQVGVIRYALEGRDTRLLHDTQQHMQRITRPLAEKYRSRELLAAAADPSERGAKLAQLYLERAFKLLDEDYAEIPRIEKAIRETQQQ
jgi:hypothetical protein